MIDTRYYKIKIIPRLLIKSENEKIQNSLGKSYYLHCFADSNNCDVIEYYQIILLTG